MTVKGKTILVTGSTDGVGRYVAERLGATARGCSCTAATGRAGEAVVERIAKGGGAAMFLEADLASLAKSAGSPTPCGARSTASTSSSTTPGSARPETTREVSADGFELRFAVNYLAGFLLTRLLLPLLEKRAPSRIVNVASAGQQAIDFDDVMLTRGYSGVRAYRQSKLAQILFTIDLAEELKGRGVTVNALHPATYMDTTMVRQSGVRPMSTVEEGGEAILQLVASPGARRPERPLFQRPARGARRRAGLRRRRPQAPAGAELRTRRPADPAAAR